MMKLLIIGEMNLRSKLTTLFLGLIMCVSAQKINYPQSIILRGDTVIAFTREQALNITQINEENKSYKKILSNKDSIININTKMLTFYDSIYKTTMNMSNDYKTIMKLKDNQINSYAENEKKLQQEIDRQKKYKGYAIMGGSCVLIISYLTLLIK